MEYLTSSPSCRYVEENFTSMERFQMKMLPKWWMSQRVYSKCKIQHGIYCFTLYILQSLRCFCIWILTRCLCWLAQSLIRQKLVWKSMHPHFPWNVLYIFYLQCQSIINVILLTSAGVLHLSITWKESKIGL